MNLRDKRQQELAQKWLDSNQRSIVFAAPRMGKTRIGTIILDKLSVNRVLIAYPNTPIKQSWTDEFTKYGYNNPGVQFTTFSSLKNHLQNEWDIIVLDEIHALSEAQIESLKTYAKDTRILGLTGTLSEWTEETLKTQLKISVCARYLLETAVNEGIVSDYRIKIVLVDLDNTFKGKKGTEKEHFDKLSRTIDFLERKNKSTFFLRLSRMRIIQNSISKLQKTRELLQKSPRAVVFCGTTDIADKMGCFVYHSKKKEEEQFLEFCQGKGDHMAVVKLANAGVTIKNLDTVIFNYTDSNEENFVQKIMRCCNYDYKNKIANITIISSTENVELSWLKKALKPVDQSKITYINC